MKKLEKVLHIVNLVLIILFSVHLMGSWILGWVFDALFFEAILYIPVLCVAFALERWVQVFTAETVWKRFVVLVSALLLTVAGAHMWWAGITQPVATHDEALICRACLHDAVELYLLPALAWAVVRVGLMLYHAPQEDRLLCLMNFGIFAAWFIHTLLQWGEAINRYGPGFFMSGGYYAGRVFVPVLMLVNVTLFLTRNVRETVQEVRS